MSLKTKVHFHRSALRLNPKDYVCVRCGSGHSETFLRRQGVVRRTMRFWESYRCPKCGGWNLLTED